MRTALFILVVLSTPFLASAQTPTDPTAAGERRAQCASLILPYEEWEASEDTKWSLEVARPEGGALFYFGAVHSSDPSHPQFAEIETAFRHFRPTLVFYEGPLRPQAATAEQTITEYGESGFVRFLAAQDSVALARLEPDPRNETAYVLQRFTPEQTKLFFVLRETARLRERRGLGEAELAGAIAKLLERTAGLPGFEGVFTTVEELAATYNRHWQTPPAWWQAPENWFDPLLASEETGGLFTNDVNRASSHFRNLNMYRVLSEAVEAGHRVFAVVGRNHVPLQADALACALK